MAGSIGEVITTQNQKQTQDYDGEEEAAVHAMQLSLSYALPAVLNTVVFELGLLEIISKAAPAAADGHLSAAEIASHLPTKNPKAAFVLDRMLRLLSAFSILSCKLCSLDDGSVERVYGLAPTGKLFVGDENGDAFVATGIGTRYKPTLKQWHYLKDVILEDIVPFEKAYGMPFFCYGSIDPVFNQAFNKAMSVTTTLNMRKMLEMYDGFDGIKVLVDVAGGTGANLNLIISKHPHIKGINFDLPQVVQDAPSYPGIKHIGGSMFEMIPKGDAIFMKSVLHNWGDEDCVKLLKSCYEAMGENGKVIVVTVVAPEAGETSTEAKFVTELDIMMLVNFSMARERTKTELNALAKAAGFCNFKPVCSAHGHWVIELRK
ncbi:hypothetical protein Ancab_021781 [Ancistrocladus abbreviatus]